MDEQVLFAGFYFTRDEWESLVAEDQALMQLTMADAPRDGAETKTRPPRKAASGIQPQIEV